MGVNPSVCSVVGVNPNVCGAIGVNPNVYGAIGVNPDVYGANGDVGNPSMVLAPVHVSASNQGFNFSDQTYGHVYNAYSNQPIFNTYCGEEYFLGCDYGTQPIETAFANYNVQINQTPAFGSGYQGLYQPF